MKNLLIALIVFLLPLQSFAGLDEKEVIGKWKYVVEIDYETLTGTLKFENKNGRLIGEVQTDDGQTFSLTKVEIKENNILYFELQPDYDVIKASLTVEDNKFKGMIGNYDGEVPISGEKIE